jgi:L-fucose mutarotase
MLKNIPSILSPELLKILMEMGHGDELVIGDGNFPSAGYAKRLVRLDGHGVPEILDAILTLFPLDTYSDHQAWLMEVVPGDDTERPAIWDTYEEVVRTHEKGFTGFGFIERFAFYERAKEAYAIVASGERAIYANIILKKGVVIRS